MQLKALSKHCSGCGTCRLICGLANYGQVNPALSALIIKGRFPEPGIYEITVCDQCGICAEACSVNAIEYENGVYLINSEICIDCGECVPACPHQVMFEHPVLEAPIKCTLCGECAEICPCDALAIEP